MLPPLRGTYLMISCSPGREEEEAQRGYLLEISPAGLLLVPERMALVSPAVTPSTSPAVVCAMWVTKV